MAENNGETSNCGFASMDREEQREIARKVGQSIPDEKRSFPNDPELASEARSKGAQCRSNDRVKDDPENQSGASEDDQASIKRGRW